METCNTSRQVRKKSRSDATCDTATVGGTSVANAPIRWIRPLPNQFMRVLANVRFLGLASRYRLPRVGLRRNRRGASFPLNRCQKPSD